MTDFRTEIYPSISWIKQMDWHALWPDSVESYNFYLSTEKGLTKNFTFYYLVIFSGEKVVLIAPLFVGDLDIGIALEGFLYKIVHQIQRIIPRFMIIKTLFCGSPISDKGVIGIHPEFLRDGQLFSLFDQRITSFTKECKAKLTVFKDFIRDELIYQNSLLTGGYFNVESFPLAVVEIDFKTMDEYFLRLSYQTRKDFRRKIKKVKTLGGLKVTTVNNIDDCSDEVYALYRKVELASNIHFESASKDFFEKICHYMPNEIIYFLYWVDGKLIGFNLCLIRGDTLVDKYIGWDYEMSLKYSLYYISFFNNIQWCLDNKKRYYNLGQGEYSKKSRLGVEFISLILLVRHLNPVSNFLFKMFSDFLESQTVKTHGKIDEA